MYLKPRDHYPPRLAQKFLLGFLRDEISEEVQGDLEELFYSDLERSSPFHAKINYYYQVLNYLRPFAMKKFKSSYSNSLTMHQHDIKISWRNLTKQKMYSVIKIGGLALGIAACFLIALYIKDELSYDESYPAADRIYRVVGKATLDGVIEKSVSFPAPMSGALLKDFPQIEISARLLTSRLFAGAGSNHIRPSDKTENTYEEGFAYADASFLDLFQIPVIYGTKTNALQEPNTMVITKSKADKYFPGQNPVGKVMFLNNDRNKPWKISAVIGDLQSTSHLQYNFYLSLSGIEWWKGEQSDWNASNYLDYILVRPGTNAAQLGEKMTSDILHNYYLPLLIKAGVKNPEKELTKFSLLLQPVSDIHLRSYDIKEDLPHGDIRFVLMFSAIAVFILVIAFINFINLSTAKSANRAREIGLKKVAGASRIVLIKQFLTESLLFSFISFFLGVVLAWILLPYFNMVSSHSLVIPWTSWWLAPVILFSALVTGLVAGSYPSIYLSSFMPNQVLKGDLSRGSKNSMLRNSLVIFQFSISIFLIISTIVVYSQMHFILNKKLGYDKDRVILVKGANTLSKEVKNFKEELLKSPQITNVSISDYLPVTGTKRNGNTFWIEGKQNIDAGVIGQLWRVDNDYIKTLGMKILEGRDFNPGMASDSQAVIINQSLANRLSLKDPIGKRIYNGSNSEVIGVVEDFNFESLHNNIGPLCMQLGNSPSVISIKVNGTNLERTVSYVASVWKSFSPDQPFRYTFLDESYAEMYADVKRLALIITGFALLAIVIACLGLFGLSAFIAQQRTKEIGIRKVMGAGIGTITLLMTREFLIMVGVSFLIASPVAGWAMSKWLSDFAYHITISWWVFALGGFVAIAIALMTVSFQSIKAAMTNPVNSLKKE
jgi:putative ABC transport system permease protein